MATSAPFRRPFGRLLGASAIVASIFLHGGAAALALLVLPRVMTRPNVSHQEEAPVLVDINVVAPSEREAEPEARPQSARSTRASRRGGSPQRARGSAPAIQPQVPPSPPVTTPEAGLLHQPPVRPVVARFALSGGSIAGRSDVVGERAESEGHGPVGAGDGTGTEPLSENAVDQPARIAVAAPPTYPESARRAEVELDLPLELVVSPQGRVVAARALTQPGYGLEAAALAAVRSYVFHPARRAGREVPVRMKWTMRFRLR